MVHDGHFQIGPVIDLVERGGETPKIGTFDIVLLIFVCEITEGVVLTLDFSITEETVGLGGWVGTKEDSRRIQKKVKEKYVQASTRHFSGYFFPYSSCARANFGHENGVILPST